MQTFLFMKLSLAKCHKLFQASPEEFCKKKVGLVEANDMQLQHNTNMEQPSLCYLSLAIFVQQLTTKEVGV